LFFSSKCRLFHNAAFFGSCIHILHTGVLKFKCKTPVSKVKLSGSIEIAEASGSGVGHFIMDYREFKDS
jgi:hypothetical protein